MPARATRAPRAQRGKVGSTVRLKVKFTTVAKDAYQAAIASCGISQDQAHGRNSIAVLPIRIGVPIGTRTAVVTFALSR